MELESNHHSVFLLHYHLVLVVKYRRKVFDDIVSARAREIFEYIAPKYGDNRGGNGTTTWTTCMYCSAPSRRVS